MNGDFSEEFMIALILTAYHYSDYSFQYTS